MKTIHTKHAPAAIGPYSQASTGGRIYISFRTNRYRPGRRKNHRLRHCRTNGTGLQKYKSHFKKSRNFYGQCGKNDLLPHRHERLCRL